MNVPAVPERHSPDRPEGHQVTYSVKMTPRLVLAILGPYFGQRVREQVLAVLPITLFLFLFQVVVVRQSVLGGLAITAGLAAVVLGLMFFMEGLRLGLMPLGENIGATLPAKAHLGLLLGFAFVLGVGATLAEPAIGTLKAAGANVRPEDSVLLFDLLNRSQGILVGSVAIGVGVATVLGVLRFIASWSLKRLLLPTLGLALVLTLLAELQAETRGVVALAWDTGAITTGPVTVPLVLALGVGVSAVLGKSDTGMSGFGVVTLASLWPVIAVLCASLAILYSGGHLAGGEAVVRASGGNGGMAVMPDAAELLAGSLQATVQAIVPLALLLYAVQRVVLREEVRNLDQVVVGLSLALIGLFFFNAGLGSGLIPLGQQVGGTVPVAFAPPEQLYGETAGRIVALIFAFALGYGATLAEPALNAMGLTVEDITAGAFKKALLMHAVAAGVALGLSAGLAKILFSIPITYLVIPAYLLLIGLTLLSDEKFTNIGWDSAGVTTGPITVPLVLALGLGVAGTVGAPDGFGMLALASIGPILTVLAMGIVVARFKPAAALPVPVPHLPGTR